DQFDAVFVELRSNGRVAQAETPLRRALTFFLERAAESPQEARYQKCIADVQLRLGQAIGNRRPGESEHCFRAAVTGYEKLVASIRPEDSMYRLDLGHSYRWLAAGLDQTTKAAEREKLTRQAALQFEVLLKTDNGSPGSQYQRWVLADTYRRVADD